MEPSTASIRFGVPPAKYLRPMFHAWRTPAVPSSSVDRSIVLTEDHPGILAGQLRQGNLGAAFLSPIDFAKSAKQYEMVPQLGVLSAGESGVLRLMFRDHIRNIETVAFPPTAFSGDVVLTHLILAEKYEVHPKMVPYMGSAEAAFGQADAVLISGDAAAQAAAAGHPWLDLVDEWTDMVEMPYVHGLWIAPKGSLTPEFLKSFISKSEKGVQEYRAPEPEEEEWLAEYFAYTLHDDAVASLGEFLRLSFYHGVLEELIEPKFFRLAEK